MSKQWGPGAFFLAPSSPRHSLSQSYHPPNVPWGSAGGCWPLALGVWDGEGVIRTLPGSLANTLTASSTPSSPGFSDPYCLLGIEQGMTVSGGQPRAPAPAEGRGEAHHPRGADPPHPGHHPDTQPRVGRDLHPVRGPAPTPTRSGCQGLLGCEGVPPISEISGTSWLEGESVA